jgi:hypothetical protein
MSAHGAGSGPAGKRALMCHAQQLVQNMPERMQGTHARSRALQNREPEWHCVRGH